MTPGGVLPIAAGALVLGLVMAYPAPRAWLGMLLVGCASALAAAVWVWSTGNVWEWRSAFPLAGEWVHLRLDGLSALFLALLAVVGGTTAVYSREYWAETRHPISGPAALLS